MSQVIESSLLAETHALLRGKFADCVNGREYWLRAYTTEHELGPYVTVAAVFEHPKSGALTLKANASCALDEYCPEFVLHEWPYRTADMLHNLERRMRLELESAA